MHKSRLGNVIIDCEIDDLEREALFRGAALGGVVSSRAPVGVILMCRVIRPTRRSFCNVLNTRAEYTAISRPTISKPRLDVCKVSVPLWSRRWNAGP